MKTLHFTTLLCITVALLLMSGCAGIKYNQTTIDYVTRIKPQTNALIDKANTDYTANAAQAQALKDSFQVAIAYETKRGKTNIPTVNMWKAVNNYITTDLFNTWSKDHKLGAAAITELKTRIDKLFDYITNLENNKVK